MLYECILEIAGHPKHGRLNTFYLLKWLKINTINAIKLNQPQAIKIWLEQFSLLNSRLLFIFLWNVISNSDEFLFLQTIHETILVLTQPPDWSCTCIEWWNDFFHFTDSVPKVIIVISWLGRRQSWLKSFLSANWTFLWLGFFLFNVDSFMAFFISFSLILNLTLLLKRKTVPTLHKRSSWRTCEKIFYWTFSFFFLFFFNWSIFMNEKNIQRSER